MLENLLKRNQLQQGQDETVQKRLLQQQELRRMTALADQAEAGSQGRILDNEFKQARLGTPNQGGY